VTDLPFRKLRPEARLPSTQHPGDAGLDLCSAIDAVVEPGERLMIPTGVAVAIPDGHAGLVLPRSGLASKHGLTMANAVNLDRNEAVKILVGDRIAQLVVVALPEVEPGWVDELPESQRGEAGFGSTGTG
jgi:dUTP pyrophosphatase